MRNIAIKIKPALKFLLFRGKTLALLSIFVSLLSPSVKLASSLTAAASLVNPT